MKDTPKGNEGLVERYFSLIRSLRKGEEGSVERLVDLWDADGTFEFAGAPPITGVFKGRNAIHALYKNRFFANRMPLQLQSGPRGGAESKVALGVVDTDVHRTRVLDDKVVAGWTTTIGTSDRRGFQVSGAHTFTFNNGKISSIKVIVSPRPHESEGLRMEGLSVDDIGRLALAAWPVV